MAGFEVGTHTLYGMEPFNEFVVCVSRRDIVLHNMLWVVGESAGHMKDDVMYALSILSCFVFV